MGFLIPMLGSLVTWLFRVVVIKFVVLGVVFVAVSELTPLIVAYAGSLFSPAGLSSSFSSIPPDVWFFLDFLALDVGLPLLISAHIARFLIRRIPFVG